MTDVLEALWSFVANDKVGIPIIVAVATTLIVEYFAKPWLEARKERLIANRKQIDEVVFQFQKASGSIGALLPDSMKHPLKERHNAAMLNNARDGLYGIMESISRLPHRYVERHQAHIAKTMLFVGYLIAHIEHKTGTNLSTEAPKVDAVKEVANDLQYFDVYFLANVHTGDSQEKWYRRTFWKLFSKKDGISKTDAVIKKYNLGSGA